MLRINDWRDICRFDYQKSIKGEWEVLLPLSPSIKGWSFLTHPAKKLPFALNFLTKAAFKMYEILGRRGIEKKNLSSDLY